MSEQVIIFDTTLRDGEQSLKSSLSVEDKLQIAYALERLQVDVMEVGFPVSSPGDFKSVSTIAQNIKNSRVCALTRAIDNDIDVAAEALKPAKDFRIHTFIATSNIHINSKFNCHFDNVIDMAVHAVKRAGRYTNDIEFSCEDAGRSSIDELCKIVEAVINAGATTVNIPDTVGYTIPTQYGSIIQTLYQRVPNIDRAIISVHCHNDLGLATANSLAGIQNGARQIECTINGIGERAGNTALEEVVMALKTRPDLFNVHTNINHKEIYHASKIVSNLCNMPIQSNKAIVGENAFSHSSGIHQHAMIKNKKTYEIMQPEDIGLCEQTLNLTSRSGRAGIKERMQKMGYTDDMYDLDDLYEQFLILADKKGQIFDYDLEALFFIGLKKYQQPIIHLQKYKTQSTKNEEAEAIVTLQVHNDTKTIVAKGNGPIDAVYSAIVKILNEDIKLVSFNISAKGEGRDALGKADVVIEYQQRYFHGVGLATDIIYAAVLSFMHAINSAYVTQTVTDVKNKNLRVI